MSPVSEQIRRLQWQSLHMPFLASRGRSLTVEPGQALEVIDRVCHPDFDWGASDADGAHHQTHAVLLPGEDMLDGGSGPPSASHWGVQCVRASDGNADCAGGCDW